MAAQKRVKYADSFTRQLGHLDVAGCMHPASSRDDNALRSTTVDLMPQRNAAGRVHIQLFDSPQVKTIAEAMDSVTVGSRAAVQTEYAQLFLPGFSDRLRPVAGAIISEMARAGAIKDGPRAFCLGNEGPAGDPQGPAISIFLGKNRTRRDPTRVPPGPIRVHPGPIFLGPGPTPRLASKS